MKDRFFGEVKKVSNKYFTFDRIINEDEIIILTNNIKDIKNSPALIVGNNKAVFLKDWLVKRVHNWEEGMDFFAVKLNRKFFKVYTFQNPFEDYSFDQEDDFDSLYKVAQEQQEVNLKVAYGHLWHEQIYR
jgi:hypothetical protein